ncbi:MAG: methylated-DNA--[protein]-cysteine S-methyltransferase [Micrococcales bacterium]|nr:methylated-DNA--[protein]-cysteine S-methyltransferase [Micrococcales bacterium]
MSPTTPPTWLVRTHTPIGRLELVSDGAALTTLTIERDGSLPFEAMPEHSNRVLDRAVKQLGEYFAGRRRSFSVPLAARGTPFQHAIWDQLTALGWGEVTTYGELGMGTGRATAGRAVGGAIGANPIPIIVPCHRVLGSDGKITGYSGGRGIPTKLWLLEHEGILLAA